MKTLDALLSGIVADPHEETRWLVLADWLEENDDPRRAELLRLHRKLLATCCEPDAHPERVGWHSRIVALIGDDVQPCVPQKTLTLPGGVPMTFAFVPPGSFLMGGNEQDDERPVHPVTLTKGFFLGVHPVTQVQWSAVVGMDPSRCKGKDRSVETVSWEGCQEFCRALTTLPEGVGAVRLPTEAEWERACRAGTTTAFHFGNAINTDLVNYSGKYSWKESPNGKDRGETADVGSFPCNQWGIFDLHGNVWEWCEDAYDENFYQTSPAQDPICGSVEEGTRVLRGGSWSGSPVNCRSASRGRSDSANRTSYIGFRVCTCLD